MPGRRTVTFNSSSPPRIVSVQPILPVFVLRMELPACWTCWSRRQIFICFFSVPGSSVAPEYPHLQTKVQQVFSKKLPVLPQSDGSAPTLISGLPTIQQIHTTFNHHKRFSV